MTRIMLTGDTHGGDIHRLSSKMSPALKGLGSGDAVIICGDFGLVWNDPPSTDERRWMRWLSEKPYDVLFVDGNHENHQMLAQLPREQRFGGTVGVAAPGVYHLLRGQVYEIGGKRFFAMGGAHSIDRDLREPGVEWWPEEVPRKRERAAALEAARACGGVDFVVTHEAPRSGRAAVVPRLAGQPDEYSDWLEELSGALGGWEKWFFGHHHLTCESGRFVCLFKGVYEIGRGLVSTGPRHRLDLDWLPEPENPIGYTVRELAGYADMPVEDMRRAVDKVLSCSTMGINEQGESLVYKCDLPRLAFWLDRHWE